MSKLRLAADIPAMLALLVLCYACADPATGSNTLVATTQGLVSDSTQTGGLKPDSTKPEVQPDTTRPEVKPDTTPRGRFARSVFPADNPWNKDISREPVDPNSANLIAACEPTRNLHPDFGTKYLGVIWGMPVTVVRGTQPKVPIAFTYAGESDPGPYPIPPDAPIQAGDASDGDRHVIVVDEDNWKVYELFDAHRPTGPGKPWTASSGAVFDLGSNAQRPAGWTSADAAGLPIFPGLVRYDEAVERGVIRHALRFTCPYTRGYIPPARHLTTDNNGGPNLPPMGMRVRLKASVDISRFPPEVRVILTALKNYGMFLADNGPGWMFSGEPDPRWNDANINLIKQIKGSDFEVVKMEGLVLR